MSFTDFFLLFNSYFFNAGVISVVLIAAMRRSEVSHPPYNFIDQCAHFFIKRWVHMSILILCCGVSTYTQIGIIKKHQKIQEDSHEIYERLKNSHRLKLEIMCWRAGSGERCKEFNPDL